MDAAELFEPSRPTEPLKAGDNLGRYLLLCPIARGGMGQVWAARQTGPLGLPQVVAIKIAIPLEIASHEQTQQHLFDEAHVAASIDHPNVCKILELGSQGATLFIAMELLQGAPLSALLNASPERRLDFRVAAHLVAQACSGLHAAHELTDEDGENLEVVHRDATPHNLFITSAGELKVMDFGIVKSKNQLHQATQTGELKGKLSYLAPEQIRGKGIDRRTDIFALGGVLYLATLGRNPFTSPGDDAGSAILRITQGDYPAPSQLDPNYPPELEAIVRSALALDPADRFATAEDMRLALQSYLDTSSRLVTREEVAAVLQKHCGAMIEQRRTDIRRAQKHFDARSYAATSGTYRAGEAPPESATAFVKRDSSGRFEIGSSGAIDSLSATAVQIQRPAALDWLFRHKTWALVAALLAVGALGFGLAHWLAEPDAQPAAASEGVTTAPEPRATPAASPPVASPPAAPPALDSAHSPEPAPDEEPRPVDTEAARASKARGAKRPSPTSNARPASTSRAPAPATTSNAEAAPVKQASPAEAAPFTETVTRRPARRTIDESDPFAK